MDEMNYTTLPNSIRTNAKPTKVHSDKCRNYKSPFGQMQNLQTIHSDKCRNYKSPFGQMQKLQTIHSDKCRNFKSPFGQMQKLQQSIRTNAEITKIDSDKRQLNDSDKRSFPDCDTSINEPWMCYSKLYSGILRRYGKLRL